MAFCTGIGQSILYECMHVHVYNNLDCMRLVGERGREGERREGERGRGGEGETQRGGRREKERERGGGGGDGDRYLAG